MVSFVPLFIVGGSGNPPPPPRGGWLAACNVCRKKGENSEEREEAGAGVSNAIIILCFNGIGRRMGSWKLSYLPLE